MSSLVPTPGQHQEGDLGALRGLGRDLDQLLLRRLGEAVVERGAAEAVAVGHLDHRDAGGVERLDDVVHLLGGELVPLVVRPVAQAGVGQPEVELAPRLVAVGAGPGPGQSRVSAGRLMRAPSPRSHRAGDVLADLRGGGGHDVEVAGVRRQVVARALDLDEDRHPGLALGGRGRLVDLRLLQQPVAGHVLLHRLLHRADRLHDRVGVGVRRDRAEDRVAHDHRRLGGVEDDDRLAALRAADRLHAGRGGPGELVDVGAGAGAGRDRRHRGHDLGVRHRGRPARPRRPSGSWPGRRR